MASTSMEKREVAERFVTLFGNLQGNIEQRDQEFGEMRNSVKRCTRESEETREDVKRLARNVDEKFESTNESLNHILRILNMVVPAYALPVQEPVLLVEDDAVPTEPETTIPSEETVDVFEFLSLPQVEVETPTQEGDALALQEQAQVPERSSRDELIREWENTEREQDERGRELGDADSTESEEEEEESDDGFITNTESDQFDISDDSEDLAEFTTSGRASLVSGKPCTPQSTGATTRSTSTSIRSALSRIAATTKSLKPASRSRFFRLKRSCSEASTSTPRPRPGDQPRSWPSSTPASPKKHKEISLITMMITKRLLWSQLLW